jgi:ribosomal protein L23
MEVSNVAGWFLITGKFKRAFRGRYVYKEKDWKKAIVTLKE